MGKILGDQPAPSALTLATSCPLMGQGGDEAIAGWLDRNRDARMVVIDVFAKIRGAAPAGASAYEGDYAAVGAIKRLADNYGVPFVLVHHVRKMGSEDFLAEVSGTNGIAGAADATFVLKRARGQADGVLYVTGRDVDENENALSFDTATGAWSLLDGPADEHQTTDTRAAIFRHLRANPGTGPRAIAQATGLGEPNVKATCRRMLADGQLSADGKGRYSGAGQHPIGTRRIPCIPNPLTSADVGRTGHPRVSTDQWRTEPVSSRHLSSVPPPPAVPAALLYTIPEVTSLLRLSKTQVFEEIRRGCIQSVKVGRARRVPAQCLAEFVALLIEEAKEVA
jgi:excisionase family DNA binding protein